jgi:predicted GIY-YIG superfamily endonuclease
MVNRCPIARPLPERRQEQAANASSHLGNRARLGYPPAMEVTRESLIAETQKNLASAMECKQAPAIRGCLDLLRNLGDDLMTEQKDAAIKLLAKLDAVPTALYRHFDKNGTLLYVGVSMTVTTRMSQHEVAAPWIRQVATITLDWFGSRSNALLAEEFAIKTEKPLYNVTHNLSNGHDPEKRSARAIRASRRKREKPK